MHNLKKVSEDKKFWRERHNLHSNRSLFILGLPSVNNWFGGKKVFWTGTSRIQFLYSKRTTWTNKVNLHIISY